MRTELTLLQKVSVLDAAEFPESNQPNLLEVATGPVLPLVISPVMKS